MPTRDELATAYFDQLLMTITGGESSTAALRGSTEADQFAEVPLKARSASPETRELSS